jgi:Phage integrase, N-terminal SAM-like domain/Phage integrase family
MTRGLLGTPDAMSPYQYGNTLLRSPGDTMLTPPMAGVATALTYPTALDAALVVRETSPSAPRPPRLLDRVREALRARHYSRRTEKASVAWIPRYILFHGKRHPAELGATEITAFLSSLAVQANVAASTQNQALSALLFHYRDVLEQDLPWLDEVVRAKRPERLPVVLTRNEIRAIIGGLSGPPRLMALLLYGAGLRLLECARLRVKDVDFARNQLVVRAGKGNKDRATMLPGVVKGIWPRISRRSSASTSAISSMERVGSSCPGRWPASTPTRVANGRGSGCFRPLGSTSIAPLASAGGITCTSQCCSGQ